MKYYIQPKNKTAAWAAAQVGQKMEFGTLREATTMARSLVKFLKCPIVYGIDYKDSRGTEQFGEMYEEKK